MQKTLDGTYNNVLSCYLLQLEIVFLWNFGNQTFVSSFMNVISIPDPAALKKKNKSHTHFALFDLLMLGLLDFLNLLLEPQWLDVGLELISLFYFLPSERCQPLLVFLSLQTHTLAAVLIWEFRMIDDLMSMSGSSSVISGRALKQFFSSNTKCLLVFLLLSLPMSHFLPCLDPDVFIFCSSSLR